MAYQLPVDCLNEIFEYLEEDKPSLHSCLLVNRLWCKISVRILWRNIWNSSHILRNRRLLSTLIACLPNESKEILYNNKIIFSTSTSKPPIFNYASFCKSLTTLVVRRNIRKLLEDQLHVSEQNLNDKKNIVLQEIFKFLMKVTSLRTLNTDIYLLTINLVNFLFINFKK